MKHAALSLAVALALSACATPGPKRSTVGEALAGSTPEPAASSTVAQQAPPSGDEQKAGPFSAGLLLGVGVPLRGGELLPLQLATGMLSVGRLGPRSVNLLALGGVSTSIPKDGEATPRIRGAWGLGAGLELTPGTLLYEVNAGAGVLWMTGISGPVLACGVSVSPKM